MTETVVSWRMTLDPPRKWWRCARHVSWQGELRRLRTLRRMVLPIWRAHPGQRVLGTVLEVRPGAVVVQLVGGRYAVEGSNIRPLGAL